MDGTYVYLAIMSNVTVTESAYVLQALGARDAINLDGGGTSKPRRSHPDRYPRVA